MAEIPQHESLPKALLAFQTEAPKMFKGSVAKVKMKQGGEYSYKYIALDDVMTIIQPLLSKHQLVFTSAPSFGANGCAALDYRLIHAGTGEEITGVMPLMEKAQDPQSLGGAITYMRRYALTAVLNLVADDDDDAQRASEPAKTPPAVETASAADVVELQAAAKGLVPDQIKLALGAAGVSGVTGWNRIPSDKVAAVVKALASVERAA